MCVFLKQSGRDKIAAKMGVMRAANGAANSRQGVIGASPSYRPTKTSTPGMIGGGSRPPGQLLGTSSGM